MWRALTDHREFGEWFRVKLDGPFVAGQVSRGHITYPGYEHLKWEATVRSMEPERLFSFTWHPYAVDPKIDYAKEPTTLVEFRLEPMDGGTVLTSPNRFDAIRRTRFEAFRMNEGAGPSDEEHSRAMSRARRRAALKGRAAVFARMGDETRLALLASSRTGRRSRSRRSRKARP